MTPSSPHDPARSDSAAAIEDAAIRWLTERDDGFTPAREREFAQWLRADPRHAAVLTEMRRRYDAELAAIAATRVEGHGYEKYPVLFSRTIPWLQKPAPAAPPAPKGKRKAGKQTDGG